jgi:hypothetical protein
LTTLIWLIMTQILDGKPCKPPARSTLPFDVIIIKVILPKGGLEILRIIREQPISDKSILYIPTIGMQSLIPSLENFIESR